MAPNEVFFLEIYSKYKNFVYSVIRFHSKESKYSDDIFQETWVEIYRGLDKFRGDSKISTWIYSVTRNTTFKYIKKENRQPAVSIQGETAESAGRFSPDTAVITKSGLADAVECLEACQREVIILKYNMQMSYEEIAAEISLPVSTVKSRLFEAKNNLRKKLLK
jgi:RNA polymerase sigma-70 factor (ECF subfamily)